MPYDPAIHHRRSIRLRGHNYSGGGVYFVTLCTQKRQPLFGAIVNGRMALNKFGAIAREEWLRSAEIRDGVALDEWVIMPDHIHGIVSIPRPMRSDLPVAGGGDLPVARTAARPRGAAPGSLGALVAGFKGAAGRRINAMRKMPGAVVWHRNYHERIVRNAADLERIRRYIRENPRNYEMVMNGGEPQCLGNRALLDMPKVGFLASRGQAGPHGNLPLKPGEVIMSGFLSPMERAVFRAGLEHKRPMIWVLPAGLDAVGTACRRAIEGGRLLVMSPFDPVIETASLRRAAWCNHYVVTHCDRLVVGHLNPDGLLACILAEADPGRDIVHL